MGVCKTQLYALTFIGSFRISGSQQRDQRALEKSKLMSAEPAKCLPCSCHCYPSLVLTTAQWSSYYILAAGSLWGCLWTAQATHYLGVSASYSGQSLFTPHTDVTQRMYH